MRLRLIIVKGPDEGKVYKMSPGKPRVVGRDSISDLVLNDVSVSRSHCRIYFNEKGCAIEDMNSRNGVVLNGERILRRTDLHDGDVIKLGTSILKAELRGAPEAGAEPATAGAASASQSEPEPSAATAQPKSDEAQSAGAVEMGDEWFAKEESPAKGEPTVAASEKTPATGESFDIDFSGALVLEDEPGAAAKTPPAPTAPSELDVIPFEIEEEAKDDESVLVDGQLAKADPRIGHVIGGFRVDERLGEDDLSIIYLATQLSMRRPAELRVLVADATRDPKAVKRFVDATRAAGRLTHPHIQQVYDAGEADGAYYVALERVEGRSVQELAGLRGASNPLPVEMVLQIGSQVADALNYAQVQRIIHGSIGLDNILVTRHGMAKLAELGFAKGLENLGQGSKGVTPFTAPEQIGPSPQTGPRTDIYALGAVLFTLLCGKPPYTAPTEQELAQKILGGKHESLQKLRPSLPAEVYKIVEKAMSPPMKARYPNAAELQEALAAVVAKLH